MTLYRTIVADPPWEMPDSGPRTAPDTEDDSWAPWTGRRSVIPYSRMSVDEIAQLPINALADDQAHLYLWTTNRFLEASYSIVREWGFQPSTVLTWCKPPMGLGFGGAYVLTTEFVLFAWRGACKAQERVDSTWFQWPRGVHSAKPDAFLDMVERVSPAPRLEMFARRARFGWDYYGDESLGTAEMAS